MEGGGSSSPGGYTGGGYIGGSNTAGVNFGGGTTGGRNTGGGSSGGSNTGGVNTGGGDIEVDSSGLARCWSAAPRVGTAAPLPIPLGGPLPRAASAAVTTTAASNMHWASTTNPASNTYTVAATNWPSNTNSASYTNTAGSPGARHPPVSERRHGSTTYSTSKNSAASGNSPTRLAVSASKNRSASGNSPTRMAVSASKNSSASGNSPTRMAISASKNSSASGNSPTRMAISGRFTALGKSASIATLELREDKALHALLQTVRVVEARERREGKAVGERRAALLRPRPAWTPSG